MDQKEQFQKILEWMRQINRSLASQSDNQDKMNHQLELMEKKLNIRIDALDERFDSLFEAIQALLKAMRGLRVDQSSEKKRFERVIQKIRQEIRELMH